MKSPKGLTAPMSQKTIRKHALPPGEAGERIRKVCRSIPEGCVASYGQLADLAGLPGRARMVGRALGDDDDRSTLPWHRVLRADGKIAFPTDSDIFREQRERLLAEGVLVQNGRVALDTFGWKPSLVELAFGIDF